MASPNSTNSNKMPLYSNTNHLVPPGMPSSVNPEDPLNLNEILGGDYGGADDLGAGAQGFSRENSFSSTDSDPPYIVEMEDEPDVRPRRSAKVKRNASFAHSDVMKYRRAFNSHDYQKDGKVAAGDLQAIVKRIGYRLSESQVEDILNSHGLMPEEKITFEKFLDLVPRNETHITDDDHKMADLREKFQRYDHDNKGQISLQEAQWALQVELKISPTTALRLLNQFVKLNYDQFVEFYQQVQAKKLEIYEKFGRYDQDQDGMISAEEAHEVLQDELGFTAERSRAMVARYDLNKDGLVSYMEFAEFYIAVEERKNKIRAAFRHFDTEGKGYVSEEEAQKILKDGLGFSDGKCAKAIETFHKDGKEGKLYYEGFLKFYSMVEEERQRLMAEFTKYDTDEDGRISYDEFKEMLVMQGYKDEEVDTLMAGYDLNHDGFLDFDEFKMFLNFQE